MNKLQSIIATVIITATPFVSFAAEQIQQTDNSLEQIAVISTFGASTPEELTEKLAQKADTVGASKFKITATSSNDNSERGTAIAYK